jgi:hypothetical protein
VKRQPVEPENQSAVPEPQALEAEQQPVEPENQPAEMERETGKSKKRGKKKRNRQSEQESTAATTSQTETPAEVPSPEAATPPEPTAPDADPASANPPAATPPGDIGDQLLRMQSERQQLQIMRAQVADEVQRMRAGRITAVVSPTSERGRGDSATRANRPRTMRVLLDPGRANSRGVSDVLSEIVVLGRLSGIHIATLETGDCRTCELTRLRTSSHASAAGGDRTVLEVRLVSSDEGQPQLWDQFQASLCMIIPLDAGLAGMFPLGSRAAESHPYRGVVRDAVGLATAEASRRAAQNPVSRAGAAPVDLITQQLQKIEGLVRRLATDSGAVIELASPDDGGWTSSDKTGGRRQFWFGKRFWIGSLASASAAGIGAGAYWWPAIVRLLGMFGE